MDDYTARVLAKWPDVPAVYGWLRLDRRGQWRLKGEVVRHRGLTAYLNRGYAHDASGRWFCHNGPQQVFVQLDYTPWVLHLTGSGQLETHTGEPILELRSAYLDDQGALLINTEHGVGVIGDLDLPTLFDTITDAAGTAATEADLLARMAGESLTLTLHWQGTPLPLGWLKKNELANRFRFVAEPATA